MSWPECYLPDGVFVPGAVLKTQLRALATELGCSRNEAIGIIISLWLYGSTHADENGLISGDEEWLWKTISSSMSCRLDHYQMVAALEDVGIIERIPAGVVITGWRDTQAPVYTLRDYNARLAEKRRMDSERKQRKRAELKAGSLTPIDPVPLLQTPELPPPEEEKPKKKSRPKKPAPDKIKYAEFVHLTEAEHEKLVEKFGEKVTEALIEKLDNAKGAKGYTYKSDYRAILNWVVDELKHTRPDLFKTKASPTWHNDNPF